MYKYSNTTGIKLQEYYLRGYSAISWHIIIYSNVLNTKTIQLRLYERHGWNARVCYSSLCVTVNINIILNQFSGTLLYDNSRERISWISELQVWRLLTIVAFKVQIFLWSSMFLKMYNKIPNRYKTMASIQLNDCRTIIIVIDKQTNIR